MSVLEAIERASNRFYDAIRSQAARRAAAEAAPTATGFDHLRGHKYALLVTYRRTGEPLPTPIWFGLDDRGRTYVRTGTQAAKVKRIRNNPRVLLAPCTVRGKPLGGFAEGRARIVPREDEAHAEAALQSNYGLGRKLYEGSAGSMPAHYIEVEPASGPGGGSG